MPHFLRPAVALLLALSCVAGARAEDVQIAAFYGRYEGTGITEKLESVYYGMAAPDIDVEIGPAGNGFFVQWTSVERESADPSNPSVRRIDTRIQFVQGGHSGTYRAVAPDAKVGGAYVWATVSGQTLTVHLLAPEAAGGFELQTYERSLTDLGMALAISRVRNAQQLLFLRGRMMKVSP